LGLFFVFHTFVIDNNEKRGRRKEKREKAREKGSDPIKT
jgi:hypothetical protein